MVPFTAIFPQEIKPVNDTNQIRQDTTMSDTTGQSLKLISRSAVDKEVKYSAAGLKKNDLVNKTATLVDKAVVTYGNIEIRADSIVFNMASSTVYASSRKDSTAKAALLNTPPANVPASKESAAANAAGKSDGKPVFKDGSQEYKCDSLTYNFVTKKAVAYNITTKQDEGLLRSSVTKLLEDGTSNIGRSTYSTCDAEHPHFYISLSKAKVYPGKKIVSGPGYLVLEGIPLPVALPFGYFPVQTKRAASGIIIPKIGQEQLRGYNLTDGGYYFAINDYFDLALKGSIYTNGTWILTAESNYNRLYRYSGQFSFNYASNISGHKGLSDYSKSTNYKIAWTYSQSAKAHPGARFSANVNMSSSGYDKTNSYTVSEHVTTQRQSSISYSKSWDGTPFNLSASMNQSQNVTTKTVIVDLPKVNFNMSRIYPLKGKNSTGSKKWYQELQFQYSAALDNKVNTYDTLLFKKDVWSKMQSGFKHEAPISIQFRPFKNFSISPQVSYSGVFYTQKTERFWNPNYYDETTNKYVGKLMTDTTRGAFYGQAVNPSVSASFSPQIFGTYIFGADSRVQAIRHVMKPSVSFSYVPAFSGLSSKMYYRVQTDTLGHTAQYSIFDGNLYGTPSLSRRSGSVNFNLTNIVEAKVFEKNDTSSKPKKVKIIDNFAIATAYNIFADSMRWSPVTMALRTTLMNNIGISASSSFSLYGLDKKGKAVADFAIKENNKLMRLTNFSVSLDFDLGQLIRGDKKGGGSSQQGSRQSQGMNPQGSGNAGNLPDRNTLTDDWGYSIFDVPWSMKVNYNFNYTKPALVPTISQTLSVNGNITLTKKMAVSYTTGYDFREHDITMTQIGITRDLHCWDMSFNWVPNGTMKSWNFLIRVKASVLKDLKYERRKDYHDTYY